MSWCNKIMHLVQCKFAFFACRERGNAWKGQIQFQYTFSLHDDAHTCLPTTILNLTALMALHYQPSKATSGRVTNPILFCQLLTIKEHCRKFGFLKKTRSRLTSVVLDSLRLSRHSIMYLWISTAPWGTYLARLTTLKGAVSAWKAFQESKTGGTKEKNILPNEWGVRSWANDLPLSQSIIYLQRAIRKYF